MFIAGLCPASASLAFVVLIAENMFGSVIGVVKANAPPRGMRDRPMTDRQAKCRIARTMARE